MLIIGPGTVYTLNPAQPRVEHGAVVTENDQILAIGSFEDLRARYPQAEQVDAHGKIIMPGLINTHHHIYSALARGLAIKGFNPDNFLELLDGMWWTIDDHLLHADTKACAVATYLTCIENGVTTVFDHHASYGQTLGSLDIIAKEALRFGVRSCLCYEISDRRGEEEMKKAVEENLSFIREAKKYPGVLVGTMGMHAPFTLSDETLRYCMSKNEPDAGYHIHVSEGKEDVEDSLKKYGIRPVERLEKLGLLGPKTICGHCIHLTEEEKDILKEKDCVVIHNPESNMGNAVGYPDVLGMYHRGILIGLGTDAYTSDMYESYKVANFLCKIFNKDSTVGWSEIPDMLFVKNREITERFFGIKTGILEEGACADVIVIDYTPFTPMDENNLYSHLVFGVNGMNVISTISQGVVRMKDRELIGINKEEEFKACAEQAADLWNRINNRP